MMRKLSLAIVAVMALFAVGCRDQFFPVDPFDPRDPKDPRDPDTTQQVGELQKGQWCLVQFEEVDGATQVDPSLGINLTFNSDGSVSGFTGCNGVGGNYSAAPNNGLKIFGLISTKMWCNDASKYEDKYVQALEMAHSYQITGDALRIYYGKDQSMLFQQCSIPDDSVVVDPPTVHYVKLDQEFQLPVGGHAEVAGEDLVINFNTVLEDSRCPHNVDCVWEGNGRISLSIGKKGIMTDVELNTTEGAKSAEFMEYTVSLLDLTPYPQYNVYTPLSDYEAKLVVTKR